MMKHITKKWGAALLAAVLCLTAFSGCTAKDSGSGRPDTSSEPTGDSRQASPDSTLYEFPTLGMNIKLPESLMDRLERGEIITLADEQATDDGAALRYALFSWNRAVQSQQSSGDDLQYDPQPIGALGVYQTDMVGQLDTLTRCDTHKELGQSADGAYQYYLSTNSAADPALVEEIQQIQVEIVPMEDYQTPGSEDWHPSDVTSVGVFTTQDINGQTVTQDIFKDYDLTLVNIFATWCSPCVAEMPDLEQLRQQMADRNVNVIGIVMDVANTKGKINQEDLERAQQLAEKTGVTYPVLVPDSTALNGRLSDIEAYPETFFVDKNGNIVGETYVGSRSLEDWTEVVEQELAKLKENT